jgi:ubiquinol-cytochrome c reductase cytochrome c subunit
MKKLLPLLFLIPVVLLAQRGPAGNSDKGRELFVKENCYYCHGTVGQGSRDGARIAATSLTVEGMIRYVRKPSGAMPAYTEKSISDADLREIYTYLKAIPAPKPPAEIPILDKSR